MVSATTALPYRHSRQAGLSCPVAPVLSACYPYRDVAALACSVDFIGKNFVTKKIKVLNGTGSKQRR